ncbi:MFS transporter [Corynebacterium uterequi]|uniref:Major Facilitator Superfamily transporter n=1 Tax=Corynebacterium uterequi TaxID=1072256 RepID=A0A0G3HC11_9CORY|nr:MFS transporter [Corynebacterium uterequi]AKK10931.1 Major Facilitator Superfamily transporter [Corynebacterium uterequi]
MSTKSPSPWLTLAALSLGFFMALLDQSTVAVVLPAVAEDLGVSYADAAWVSSAYLLAIVAPMLVTGRLGDRYGAKRMFLIGCSVFVLAAVGAAVSPTLPIIIGFRFIQGLGAAMLMPQTMAVINQVFPASKRGTAYGLWGVVGAVASLLGPVLSGVLVENIGWRSVFLLNVPVGIVAVLLGTRWVPTLPTQAVRIEFVSVVLCFLGLIAVVSGIQQGLNWVWLLIGLVVLWLFVRRQHGPDALMPLRLFRSRNFCVGMGTLLLMGVLSSTVLLPLMNWLIVDRSMAADQAGFISAPMALTGLVFGPLCGMLSDKVQPKVMHLIGFGGVALAMAGFAWVMSADGALWGIGILVALYGVAQSFIWSANAAASLADIDSEDSGVAAGVYNVARQFGGVIGVASIGAAVAGGGNLVAVVILATVAVVAAGCSLAFTQRPATR